MRFQLQEELSVYEAFMKYGLGDGDHPLAGTVKDAVYTLLEELGYQHETASTPHNDGFIYRLISPQGQVIDMDYCCDPEPHYIRSQLPEDLVKALDELNAEIYTGSLIS